MLRPVAVSLSLTMLLGACGAGGQDLETEDAPVVEEGGSEAALPALEDAPSSTPSLTPSPTASPTPDPVPPQVVLAAGDVAWCGPDEDDTGRLLDTEPDAPVLALGDLAYDDGSLARFQQCYLPAWGHALERTYPVPGNHDAQTPGLAGYFDTFGDRAGHEPEGYYSFALGPRWHAVALNSNCTSAAPCAADGSQVEWLRQDLAALDEDTHVLAYWHHPRFSSGAHGDDPRSQAFWDVLVEHGADIVLNGHEHGYERFAPRDGIRQFTVGTGGAVLRPFPSVAEGSVVRVDDHHGVLRLELQECGYVWRFLTTAEDGGDVDAGGDRLC